jgi:hypothetical protein
MSTRTCIFCGGGPLSNEHAWQRWLVQELLTPGSVIRMRWGSAQGLTHVDAKGLEVKVRRACVGCNTGWMSKMERAVKAVLLPLVRGQVNQLAHADQQFVATWAQKTAMMLQFTSIHKTGIVIVPSLYQELYAHPARPAGSLVAWIGQETQQPPPGALFGLRGMVIEQVDVSGTGAGSATPPRLRGHDDRPAPRPKGQGPQWSGPYQDP